MQIKDLLQSRRKELGLTLADIAKACDVSESTVSRWESGNIGDMKRSRIAALSKILKISPSTIVGSDGDDDVVEEHHPEPKLPRNVFPMPAMKKVPIIGEIACGKPVFAAEEYGELAELPVGIHADFALKAKGDSMIGARIHDGDVVFCKSADIVDNGKVAAVIIDDEATLKRFYYYKDKNLVILKPENPEFEDMIYSGEEIGSIHVLGQAVAFQSIIR